MNAASRVSPPPHAPTLERLPVGDVRFSMGRIIGAWGFGAAFFTLTSGAVYTSFARAIGANDVVFGILAAALPLLSFLQIFTARLLERTGRRKAQMVPAGLIGRALWVVAAMVPMGALHLPQVVPQSAVLPLVLACILGASACQSFVTPAFFSWCKDLVPDRLRPAFFARRMQVGTLVAMTMTLGGGYIADTVGTLEAFCGVLALAGLAGMAEMILFARVAEPSRADVAGDVSIASPVAPAPVWEPLRDPAVRSYLTFASLMTFSFGAFGPFVWLYMLETLGLSKVLTGFLLSMLPQLAIVGTSRFWGGMIHRYGTRPVMRFYSAGLMFVPLVWLVPGGQTPLLIGLVLWASGTLFCAHELCNQNLITDLTPHVPPSTMTALVSICTGTAFALASCLGGLYAQFLEGARLGLFGHEFVPYQMLFLASLATRLANAVFVAPRLRQAAAPLSHDSGTMDAVREVVPELAHTLAGRITRPFGARGE